MSFADKVIYFNQKQRVLSHILFWLVLLLIQLSSSSYYNSDLVPFRNNLIGDGTNLMAQMPAAYILAYFIVPRYVYKQKYWAALAWFLLSCYIICVLSRLEVIFVEEPLYGRARNPQETITEILTDISKLAYVYFFRIFSVAFVFMFLKLLKDQLFIQKRALQLEKEKAQTELKLLKTQLNPHFLFNTLNNIYSLSLSNSPVTSTSINRLAEILDYMLYRCNSEMVPLAGEIALLQNYIGLEKLRYDERLELNFKIAGRLDIAIAPLLLLSIVENAFKHGAGNDVSRPIINIDLNADAACFYFEVSNSFQPGGVADESRSIGIANLRQQLALVYPEKHRLNISKSNYLFTVTLQIDL